MTKIMIVMLIWAGGPNGGPAVLPGFATMQACNMSVAIVRREGPGPCLEPHGMPSVWNFSQNKNWLSMHSSQPQ